MRKLLTILLTVLTAALVLVGCSMETKVEDGLALLAFRVSEQGLTSKSLTRTNPVLDEKEFYWYYTATKTDGTGLTVGATAVELPVNTAGTKGLKTVGPFSYGDWEFTLYGYANYENAKAKNLAYSGTAKVTVKAASNDLVVTVESKQSDDGVGYLDFPEKGNIALTGDGLDSSKVVFSKFVEKITIARIDGVTQADEVLYDYNPDTSETNGLRRKQLKSGSYSVTFSYLQGATKLEDGKYEGGYAVAQETLYVAIADYLTTTIGGDIASNTGEVKISVKNGIVEVKSAPVQISDTETTTIKVEAAPVSKEATSTTDESAPSTSIAIPAGAIEGKNVVAATTSYTREAASSRKATFTIQTSGQTGSDEGSGGDGGAGAGSTTTQAVVLGGLDIDLYVDDSTEKSTSFKNNKVLTITTNIAKGLNGGVDYIDADGDGLGDAGTASAGKACDIVIKYDGPADSSGNAKSDGKVKSYNATTGELAFTVDHLSTYYFVSLKAVVYNENKLETYENLASAIAAASAGDTLTVLKNIDLGESDTIKVDKTLTLDLGGNTITASKNRVFWVHNGTLTIDNGTIHASVAPSTSSVIRVSCDPTKTDCAACKGENLGLVFMSKAIIKAPSSYGISVFGAFDATVDIYGTIESLNACVATSGTQALTGKFTLNVYDGAKLTATGTATWGEEGSDSPGIYQPDGDAVLNIYGGTITSNFSAVEIRSGKANISGGTLKSLGSYETKANGNGPSTKGAAVAVSLHSKNNNSANGISVVLSGDVKLEGEKQLAIVNLQGNDLITKVKVAVDGVTLDESKVVGYKGVSGNYYFDATCALANDEAVAKVGDTYYVSLSEAIAAGKAAADAAETADQSAAGGGTKVIEVEVLKDTTLTSGLSGYTLYFVGQGKEETSLNIDANGNYFNDTSFKFKDLSLSVGTGFKNSPSLWFEDCNIISNYSWHWGIGDVTFKNCVFVDGNAGKTTKDNYLYNMEMYSGKDFVFEDCEFISSNGKFINAYIEPYAGDESKVITITMKNCHFSSGEGPSNKKAALNIKKTGTWIINLTNVTADNLVAVGDTTGSRLYNLESGAYNGTKITIDGVVVWENGAKVETSTATL